MGKALSLLQSGDLENSRRLYEKVREWEPENVKALQGLSLLEKESGNLKQAVKLLEEALLYRSTDQITRFNLAVLFEELQDRARAEQEYRNLLSLDASNLQARERLAT